MRYMQKHIRIPGKQHRANQDYRLLCFLAA
nr:MAG TPA: hypothetical protein [Caudoviricetes sp.]